MAATRWAELTQRATQDFPLGDSPQRTNASVSRIRLDPASVTAGQEAAVVADVACDGAMPSELTAELWRGGRRTAVQPVVAPATGATCQVRFPISEIAAGEHAWEVRLAAVAANGDEGRGSSDDLVATASDALPADDARWLVADVPRQIHVGLVVDSPHAADDLSRALTASAGATAAIGVEIVPQVQLPQRSMDEFAVLAVCNVAEYSQRDAAALRQFTSDGGGLLWVLGSRVGVESYRQRFGPQAADAPPLAPCNVERESQQGAWHIDPLGYRDAILEPFATNRRAGLLTATIARRYRLVPWGDATPAAAMHVVAACDDGVPLLATSRFGAGRAAVLGTDVALRPWNAAGGRGTPWSTLPVSPSFVPLMRRLVDDLTAGRNGATRNCLAGEPLVGVIAVGTEFHWQTPRGDQRAGQRATQHLEPGSRPSASFSETTIAGLYSLGATRTTGLLDNQSGGWGRPQGAPSEAPGGFTALRPQPPDGDALGARSTTTQFAVNVDPRESDLTAIPAAELLAAGRTALDAPAASGSLVPGDVRVTAATALATRLLIAALACLVIERLLVARAARSYA